MHGPMALDWSTDPGRAARRDLRLNEPGPAGLSAFLERDQLDERIMMADQHFDREGPSATTRPVGVDGFQSGSLCQPDSAALAARLSLGGSRRPSISAKLGPRDCCGFEMDTAEPFDQPEIGGSRSAWKAPVRDSSLQGDPTGPRPSRSGERSVADRRADVSPTYQMQVMRDGSAAT